MEQATHLLQVLSRISYLGVNLPGSAAELRSAALAILQACTSTAFPTQPSSQPLARREDNIPNSQHLTEELVCIQFPSPSLMYRLFIFFVTTAFQDLNARNSVAAPE